MVNLLLFMASSGIVAGFSWYFLRLGQSALTAWIAILSLLANLFVLKQIDFLGLNATASDVFAVGSLLSLNLLQEKFGAKATQQAIWTSFSALLFFAVISQLHLLYEPSIYDQSQSAYELLLNPAPRILFASLASFLIVDQCDRVLYQWFRQKLPHLSMIWVSALTLCLSQSLDTVLFSLLGLYGVVEAILEIMLISFGIKLLVIANTVPWSLATQRLFSK